MNNLTKDNKIELLEEDLECIRMFLDSLNVPTKDEEGEFSIIGRINLALEKDKSIEESFKKGFRCARENPHVMVTRAWWDSGLKMKKDEKG